MIGAAISLAGFASLVSALAIFRYEMPSVLADMTTSISETTMIVYAPLTGVVGPMFGICLQIAIVLYVFSGISSGNGIGPYKQKMLMAVMTTVFMFNFVGDNGHVETLVKGAYKFQYALMDVLPHSSGNGPIGQLSGLNDALDGVETASKKLSDNTYEQVMEEQTGMKKDEERDFFGRVSYKMQRFNAAPGAYLASEWSDDGVMISMTMLIAYCVFLMCEIVFFVLCAVPLMLNGLLVAILPAAALLAVFDKTRGVFFGLCKQYIKFWLTPILAAVVLSFLHGTMDNAGETIGRMDLLKDSPDTSAMWGYIAASIACFVALISTYPIAALLVNTSAGPLGATAGVVAGVVSSQVMARGTAALEAGKSAGGRFSKFAPN